MSVSISKDLSSKIKSVSFICALLVVLLHAYDQELLYENGKFTFYLEKILSLGLCGIAVPFFFVISGFLLAHQYDSGVPYSQLLKKRLKSLGKPYILWCILYVITYVAFTIYGNHLAGRVLNDNTCLKMPLYSWENPFRILGFDLFDFPSNGPLWYIRNLFFLVFLSSIIMMAMKTKTSGIIVILLSFILYILHFTIPRPWWQFFQTGFSFKGLLFFSIGIYLKRFPITWKPGFAVSLLLCLAWLAFALPWKLSSHLGFVVLHVSFIIGCIALWSVYDYIPLHGKLESWHCAKYSFFIYASHYAILNMLFCQKACVLIKKHICNSDLLIYLARFVVPVVIAIALAYFLERYMPKIYRALTGGR